MLLPVLSSLLQSNGERYQCPPVNWGINTERKRGFFKFLKEVTGS